MEEQYIPDNAESTLEGEQGQQQQSPDVTQNAETQQPVQTENVFDPKGFEYKYKGQSFTPKDRNHLTQLMSKGHSYEQSMTAINRDKQQLQDTMSRYKPYEQLDSFFQKNPQFKQDVMSLHQRQQQGLPPEIQDKLQKLEQFQSQFVQKEADKELDGQIQGARQKYSNFDWNTDDGDGNLERKVLMFMSENRIEKFEDGFRAFAFDMAQSNAQAQGLQQAAQAQVQKRRAGVVDTGNPSVQASPKAPPNFAKMSYNDAANMAKRDMQTQGR